MAWASNTGAKLDTFVATHQDGALVMKGQYNGAETRITFHDITAAHFSWKMERQNKETGQWIEIYRIEADRVQEAQ